MKDQLISNKIILTDVDGVVLDWEYAFHCWVQQRGWTPKEENWKKTYYIEKIYGMSDQDAWDHVRTFNESAAMGFLPPLRDSMHFVKKLHEEHGFMFHAITSMSDDPNAVKLREMNLTKLFGPTTFEKVICLPCGASKKEVLQDYANMGFSGYWIEDKVTNAVEGAQMGFQTLLMEHGHNLDFYNTQYTIVKNWAQIYEIILRNEQACN